MLSVGTPARPTPRALTDTRADGRRRPSSGPTPLTGGCGEPTPKRRQVSFNPIVKRHTWSSAPDTDERRQRRPGIGRPPARSDPPGRERLDERSRSEPRPEGRWAGRKRALDARQKGHGTDGQQPGTPPGGLRCQCRQCGPGRCPSQTGGEERHFCPQCSWKARELAFTIAVARGYKNPEHDGDFFECHGSGPRRSANAAPAMAPGDGTWKAGCPLERQPGRTPTTSRTPTARPRGTSAPATPHAAGLTPTRPGSPDGALPNNRNGEPGHPEEGGSS